MVKQHPTKGDKWWIIDCRPDGYKGKRVRKAVKGTYQEAKLLEQKLMMHGADAEFYTTHITGQNVNVDGPLVYFIQQGANGPIKIGFSMKPVSFRVSDLQTANPSILLPIGVILGASRKIETELHIRFSHLNIRGEWFYPHEELLDYIASINLAETE